MSGLIRNLWHHRWLLRSLPYTLWFNFHYLPWRQAVRLPIVLYKPTLLSCKGSVRIKSDEIRFAMIQLGRFHVSLFPDTGIVFENHGGEVCFHGPCSVGNNSAISIGPKGCLEFGKGVCSSTTLRLACYNHIRLEDRVRLGWNCTILDTDFHRLSAAPSTSVANVSSGDANVRIGEETWVAMNCLIMKGSVLPPRCVIAAGSLTNRAYDVPAYSLLAGQPAQLKKTGIWRNQDADSLSGDFL